MSSSQSPLRRLLSYTRHHRGQTLAATSYSVINKLFDIAPEILIGMAIDVVVSQENSFLARFGVIDPWDQILILGVVTFFIWAGESLFEYLMMIAWRGLAQKIQHELRRDTYQNVQGLDLSYFEDKSTGNLVAILNDDVNQLERFLDGGANQIIQTLTAVIGVGAVFFYLSPKIATVAFLPIPLILVGAFYFQKRAVPLYAKVRDQVGALSSRLNNNLSGIMTIKSFTAESHENLQLIQRSESYLQANEKAIAISSAFIPVIRMAILMGFLATFILGAREVFAGNLAVGSYGVLVFLTQRLLWPLTGLAATVDLYERAMASTRRILDLLAVSPKIRSGNLSAENISGEFHFSDVGFHYQSGPEIFKGIDLKLPAKKTTAFVGTTGSGKSTLIKLLLRFYEASDGVIRLDDKELSDYHLSSLRQQVGLVSQDVFLFHGTVRENLAYGSFDASDGEIQAAAKLAEAHEFIEKLADGYDTVIGERGQKLSGGQRQRLALARAILKDPKVLILDEATSAVDNETEAAIQRSLVKITAERTTIIVAHRLSTIVGADVIHVLDSGQIKESGTHTELLARKGIYHHLWSVQTGSQGETV